MFKIPILYLAYNRPNITKQTLKNIIKLNPYKLYISVDGPKKNSQDQSKVGDVRKTINKLKNLNKKMIVKKQINFKNLGCKKNNLKAINWFFKNESMGIIIEDDCLIDNHFLIFCKNMLERYK